MFAIIKSGGKQYRVEREQTIAVEKLQGDVGAQVEIRDVLLLGSGGAKGTTVAGEPMIANALVRAEIIRQGKLPKITVFKKKRRKNYRRTLGHRQEMTWLRIDGIEAPKDMFPDLPKEKSAKAAKPAAKKAAAPAKPAAEKAEKVEEKAAKPAVKKTSAPKQEPDDLKKLPGIGAATEKKLHELGFTGYAQVALPDKKLAAALAKEPSLEKILQRADVIKEAKALAKKKE